MELSNCLICGSTTVLYRKYCTNCLERYYIKDGDWNRFIPKNKAGTPEHRKEVQDEFDKDFDINSKGCP